MKTFILSLWLGALLTGAVQAQLSGADNFSSATAVAGIGGVSFVTDLNAMTLQPGEPLAYSWQPPKTAWWQWTAPESGMVAVDTVSSGIAIPEKNTDSLICIYTGSSVTTLTRVALGQSYRPALNGILEGAALSFYAEKSKVYYIQVSSSYITATARNVRMALTPLPTKTLQKESSWSYLDANGRQSAGAITTSVTPRGAVTGKVRLKSGTYSFAAVADEAGYVSASILEKVKPGTPPPSPISFIFRASKEGFFQVRNPGNPSTFDSFYDVVPTAEMPVGAWSGMITASDSGVPSPVFMKVTANQRVSLTQRYEDGTVLTHSGPVLSPSFDAAGLVVMKALSGGKSVGKSMLYYADGLGRMEGSGIYARDPKAGATFYPGGISDIVNTIITPYPKPVSGQRALGFANATSGQASLQITDPTNEVGGDATLFVTLETNNKFVFVADPVRKPTLKLNAATGQITGSVILGGKKRNLMGALHNPAFPSLGGYVIGTSKNVRFRVTPGVH